MSGPLDVAITADECLGYVKWPRIWQDAMTNITPSDSSHQRVCLPLCEVLFDVEFPEEAAAVSAQVGGRGLTLNTDESDDLIVRNYRVTLHSVKSETRKMRRIRELEEVDGPKKQLGDDEKAAMKASKYSPATAARHEPFSAPMQRTALQARRFSNASSFLQAGTPYQPQRHSGQHVDTSYKHTRPAQRSSRASVAPSEYTATDDAGSVAPSEWTAELTPRRGSYAQSDSGYGSGRDRSRERASLKAPSNHRHPALRIPDDDLDSVLPGDYGDASTIGPSASQVGARRVIEPSSDDRVLPGGFVDSRSSRRPVSDPYRNLASQMRQGLRPEMPSHIGPHNDRRERSGHVSRRRDQASMRHSTRSSVRPDADSGSYYGSILRDAAQSDNRSKRETYQTYHSAPSLRTVDDDELSYIESQLTEAEAIKAKYMGKAR